MLSNYSVDDIKPGARASVAAILSRHRGAKAELARRLSPNPRTNRRTPNSTVSLWLQGRFESARIESAGIRLASELLLAEQKSAAEIPQYA
jgi:hypothetical protein